MHGKQDMAQKIAFYSQFLTNAVETISDEHSESEKIFQPTFPENSTKNIHCSKFETRRFNFIKFI